MDLTRPDNGEAMERMTAKLRELDDDEVGAYFLLCMAILAKNAPDVAVFVMDRADQSLSDADEALASEIGTPPGRNRVGQGGGGDAPGPYDD